MTTRVISPTDMVIEILQRTDDGNDLAPFHLRLMEIVANKEVSETGLEELEKVYQSVCEGRYEKPFLYGIPHITRDHDGYILYKGKIVEHYSNMSPEEERRRLEKLAADCEKADMAGMTYLEFRMKEREVRKQ